MPSLFKPAEIFDIVLDRVRECQALDGRISAIRPDASAKGGPAAVGNPLSEYVADFEVLGRRVLEKRHPRRWEVFRLYFVRPHCPACRGPFIRAKAAKGHHVEEDLCALCGKSPYAAAIEVLRLKPGTFDYWGPQIKHDVGKALAKSDLFPPRRYRQRRHLAELVEPAPRPHGGVQRLADVACDGQPFCFHCSAPLPKSAQADIRGEHLVVTCPGCGGWSPFRLVAADPPANEREETTCNR